MKVLVIGSGGREHALCWKLSYNPGVDAVIAAPGNGGTAQVARNVAVKDSDIQGLMALAKAEGVGLVVAGPEAPLVAGIADACAAAGIPCFGPDAFAARLEGSKAFAKTVMREAGVPTAPFGVFADVGEARAYVRAHGAPLVVKADGLAAGKGVVVARTVDEALEALDDMMVKKSFGEAGAAVVVEDALQGEEASFLAFCDGEQFALLPSAQDHKAAWEGDTGPNTGGMGAYSPAPVLPQDKYAETAELCIRPILRRMAELGHPFKGVLYAGLMFTKDGPMVLEYNVRFGDPECQPLLMRLDGDLLQIMLACAEGRLAPDMVRVRQQTALCVVVAAPGYPGSYPKGMAIHGLAEADALPGVKVFQAGTAVKDGGIVTSGGRVLGVTALGDTLAEAKARAYEAVGKVGFEGAFFRRDIGDKGIARSRAKGV
ncbi:phosphoribosylamine--glycine ligase [Humidesulfovibrio mexicanus]|uniref:Phosphoribosylamine--glycine ligase n=1 Tax=Humidesulfovibrio mexicanus TaxID=147047 RepID=A0A239A6F7_9BACT|nr:phosphoribosylamine--glycine ligase [Humidesulfovibrio mexicanus]SNR90678.1 phosphoribosylamine--glycine ligase [Humidesulfovibrio mexicanus]